MSDRATVHRRAHAKINPFLRVLGRRADGFHDVETLILPIDLADDVAVSISAEGDVRSEIVEVRAGVDVPVVVDGEDLAVVAARTLAEAATTRGSTRASPGADIRIRKRIPVAAGMAGGSADAAAVLSALDELWGLAMGDDELLAVAAAIGSDVPAMLHATPVVATGRGEILTSVHAAGSLWVIRPFRFGVRAEDAYRWWDEAPATGPDPGALVAALETGNAEVLGDALFDDLQAPVAGRFPEVQRTIEAFTAAGALGAIMTGSGPTVIALARHAGHADALASAVRGSFVVGAPPPVGPYARSPRPGRTAAAEP